MNIEQLSIKYIVIEDEPFARRGLVQLLKNYNFLDCMGMYSNTDDARMIMETQDLDLIFLDIHLAEESGLEFAKQIPPSIQVIFTTAYPNYALESYDLNALDYLLKPIAEDRLKKALDKAISYFQNKAYDKQALQPTDHIFVKSDRKLFRLALDEIQYIEAMKDYVMIHSKDKKLMVAMNIKTILNKLPSMDFVRVNKSFVVNLKKIESVDNHWVTVAGFEMPLGANFKENLLMRIDKQTINR
ncbi:LytR/AlgR family response regulator transcription factor [Sphingobacterium sp. UDSM-2020]|uniref:LytR/AlgR family response regulator transcription factor n=1 Tax=Sphingobacterium sp. UDSM-2020 TaxID=2795738 RepID=UPI001936510A|nr:LytTR family DNA-binding domain-containing protein [Sphingobacterium sp. UDSM-2020]QQD13841.1 response regulator transcription factor [Sphingobacterium sp. UDSM-2020]